MQRKGSADKLHGVGLVTESAVKDEGGGLCVIAQKKRFTFCVLKAEPNRGLMNLIADGNPVLTFLSINLNRLCFVKDMSNMGLPLPGTVYEPSLYGLVTGYVKTTEDVDGSYMVEHILYESVNVKLLCVPTK